MTISTMVVRGMLFYNNSLVSSKANSVFSYNEDAFVRTFMPNITYISPFLNREFLLSFQLNSLLRVISLGR